MSAPTTRLPTFVPRLVAASERIASGVARRVTARVRAVGARAMSFADRVVGSWLGPSSTWSTSWSTSWSSPAAQERQAARAAARVGGAFVMTRPWYELPALDAIGAAPAAAAEPTVAERGAQIARTQLDAEAPRADARVESAPARDVTAAEALGLHVQAAPMRRAPVVGGDGAAPRAAGRRARRHARRGRARSGAHRAGARSGAHRAGARSSARRAGARDCAQRAGRGRRALRDDASARGRARRAG